MRRERSRFPLKIGVLFQAAMKPGYEPTTQTGPSEGRL